MRDVLFSTALALSLVGACSRSSPSSRDAGAGGDGGATDGDAGATDAAITDSDGGDDSAVPAAFGLDTRPTNTTCVAQKRPVVDTGVKLQRMWSGLTFNQPLYLTQSPGDNDRWFVVERQGKVRSFPTAAAVATDIKDFVSVTVNSTGEGGLLGLAFHPSWQTNHEAYLSYTRNKVTGDPPSPASCGLAGATVFTSIIARLKSADNGATLGAPDEILKVGQPFTNHDGGGIQFSPVDKMLYIGFGDGGSGDDPCGSGQDLTSRLGKMLRIDVNAPAGSYNIPPDNPFATSTTAVKEIWSYGHRNPWRWSFDPVAGDLWVGDVGQNTWEEIDHVVKGGNYGWNICEGFHKRGSTTQLCNTPGLLDPVVEHGRTEAQSITGGYVYRGSAMPSLVGTYIYGDYITGNIWALTYDATNKPVPKIIATVAGSTLASFGQGNDGEIYTVQISGIISKLVPSGTVVPVTFPLLLSQTGCVDPNDATRPAAGLIPYDINSPLWSDGAKKDRFFALPEGTTITVGADNDWDLPIGSVAVKTFWVEGKRVETRLFMRHDDGGWAGYSYEWNDAGTDATLLSAGKVKPVGTSGQMWTYPSRTQCMQCHSLAAGGTIGLETWQLNRDLAYPSTNRVANQLATLDHIGVFSAPLPGPPASLPRLPDPAGTDPVDQRARSYLHANCSHCHRPNGGGQGTMDLRFGQSFKDTVTCNAATTQGSVGGSSTIIVPGAPATSVLSLRVHANDSKRMPPVAVSIMDPTGSKVIDDWITSLTTCP
jgi:uncharacterized repeat protein (TIGR03806 family)